MVMIVLLTLKGNKYKYASSCCLTELFLLRFEVNFAKKKKKKKKKKKQKTQKKTF